MAAASDRDHTTRSLREVVAYCIEYGRTLIGYHGGDDRIAKRQITGGMILAALRGSLTLVASGDAFYPPGPALPSDHGSTVICRATVPLWLVTPCEDAHSVGSRTG